MKITERGSTKLIDLRQVGPALDRYDDCMCIGLLSFSYVRYWPPSLSLFVPSALTGPRWRKHRCTQRRGSRCATESKNPTLASRFATRMHRTEDYKRENTEHGIIHSPPPPPRERVASPQLVQSRLVEQLDVVAPRRTLRTSKRVREREIQRARARARARRRERDAYIRPIDFRQSRGWLALLVARNDATSREYVYTRERTIFSCFPSPSFSLSSFLPAGVSRTNGRAERSRFCSERAESEPNNLVTSTADTAGLN